MREVTIACVQMQVELNRMEDNLVKMSEWIEKIAVAQKVDLIVFPELATTGYECGVRFTDFAQRVPGPSANLIAQRASEFGVYVAFGLPSKEKVESVLYNSAVLVGPDGDLVGEYRKVHLKGEERLAFRNGFRFPVLEADFGNVGLMIGWDVAFPEAARTYALDGADLLIVCANWEKPNVEEWRTYVTARALENSIFVAASNRIGQDATLTFCGETMIVGPRGQAFAQVDEEIEGYALARIDLDDVRRYREELQQIQNRQPSAYRAVVRQY
ncbi:MAG TPA: carbon-nitrogen hydrolase family protein [Anaerolineae bacterium]|nr:carbon-nitrogen hydrolase family protein [Anaerolineae bacterium]